MIRLSSCRAAGSASPGGSSPSPESPASEYRDRNIATLTAILQAAGERSGLQLDTQVYEALIDTIENVGHRAFWPTLKTVDEIERLKETILLIVYRTLEIK